MSGKLTFAFPADIAFAVFYRGGKTGAGKIFNSRIVSAPIQIHRAEISDKKPDNVAFIIIGFYLADGETLSTLAEAPATVQRKDILNDLVSPFSSTKPTKAS